MHSIHICEGLVKNLEVIVGWIARKYKNKTASDLKIAVGNLIDDLRTLHEVKVDPQKVYRAKRKILESAAGGDHVESFRQLWNYAHMIKQQMPGALALLKVTRENTLVNKCRFERFMVSFPTLRASRRSVDHLLGWMVVI